jgi:pilus assembly protein CpaB
MGNRKSLTMFAFAALFALGAALFANEWLLDKYNESQTATSTEMDQVIAADVDIQFGQRIERARLRILEMPKEVVPSGVYRSVEEVQGKVALQTIYAGELLLEKKLRDHLGGSTLAAVIAPGKRAVTVRVNDVVGVAGFLLPGNRVDVIATMRDKALDKTVSRTLLRNVKVLAVDQTTSPEENMPVIVRAVTLELSPRSSERLIKATTEGSVQLALRNPVEKSVAEEELVLEEDPPKLAANLPEPEPAMEEAWVTLIKGTIIEKTDVQP